MTIRIVTLSEGDINELHIGLMGVHAGFADLMALCDGRVLFLELKAPKGRLRPTQEAFRDAVLAQGFGWALVRSMDDALGELADHGFTTRIAPPVRRPAP